MAPSRRERYIALLADALRADGPGGVRRDVSNYLVNLARRSAGLAPAAHPRARPGGGPTRASSVGEARPTAPPTPDRVEPGPVEPTRPRDRADDGAAGRARHHVRSGDGRRPAPRLANRSLPEPEAPRNAPARRALSEELRATLTTPGGIQLLVRGRRPRRRRRPSRSTLLRDRRRRSAARRPDCAGTMGPVASVGQQDATARAHDASPDRRRAGA